jgi:subtilase family serine protease
MDRVGNTRSTAKLVSLDSRGNFQFRDAIGARDPNDYYRLRLSRSSYLSVSLSQLSANANLELLSKRGNVIQRSAKSGTRSEFIRRTLDPGTYYLRVYPGSQQSTNYLFRVSASPLPNVDLAPSYFNVLQKPLERGDTFSVNYQVKNQQVGSASNFRVGFYLSKNNFISSSDRFLGYSTLNSLSGYSTSSRYTKTLTLPGAADSFWSGDGTFYIGMIVDYNGAIAETNESNNTNQGQWVSHDAVNITTPVASTVTVTSPNGNNSLATGSVYDITWTDNISENVRIDLYRGITFDRTITTSTPSNGLYSWWVPNDLTSRSDYRLVISSVHNSAISDWSDNYFSITNSLPDLVVQNTSAPTSAIAGSNITVSAYTKNNGNSLAGASYLRYWLSNDTTLDSSDRSLGIKYVNSLSAGASEFSSLTFTYDVSWGTGTKYILFEADGYKYVSESNETNNIAFKAINVAAALPDLVIQNASAPTSVTTGNMVFISADTKNIGGSTAGASYVRYWLSNDTILDSSDRSLGINYVNNLSAGESEFDFLTFTYDASWGTGTKYILFEADGYKYVSESNETNNIAVRTINVVAPPPDLVVQNALAPVAVTAGNTVSVSAYTKNIGGSTAGGSYIRYWLSDDTVLDTNDHSLGANYVNSLSAGASELSAMTFTYNVNWGTGTKYILFEADAYKYVSEGNETNNVAYKQITINARPSTPTTYQPFNANNVFSLHSNIGANHTIYLDFDGHITTGTSWNSAYGKTSIVTPAYDADGNPSSFSTTERQTIWEIWRRVAEDFIPFNVNVTTAAPPISDLVKTDSSDTRWGIRVAIGGKDSDWYTGSAGGVAYLNSFNYSTDTPAFVFQNYANKPAQNFAEAVSHEVGHALGLKHDGDLNAAEGTLDREYYRGHGSGDTGWGSIMGFPSTLFSFRNLTQWSKGEYAGANNQEDDLHIITTKNGFGYRADDYGNTMSTAAPLALSGSVSNTYGIIERNTDQDWFTFTSSTGKLALNINPFEHGPNLDIMAMLYNSSGSLIATSNPLNELSASFNGLYSPGQYYIRILGTGKSGIDGYSNYGSLGQYSITGSIA